MRLTLSALLCAALLAGPAFAHDHRDGPMMPPSGADMPSPPPGYAPYGAPMGTRWEHMDGDWRERCRDHDRRDGPDYRDDCSYPGAYMGYAVPMVMVPVLRSKPCKEAVEEIVEEVPVRRRLIPPRARPVRVVPDKRVPLHGKRVLVTPSKRIPY